MVWRKEEEGKGMAEMCIFFACVGFGARGSFTCIHLHFTNNAGPVQYLHE